MGANGVFGQRQNGNGAAREHLAEERNGVTGSHGRPVMADQLVQPGGDLPE